MSKAKTKDFLVDTVGPTITKEIGNPKYYPGSPYDWYVNQSTEICVTATDPTPHPVGMGEVWCEWDFWENLDKTGYSGSMAPFRVDILQDGCFAFTEDSYHELHCWAEDALGNRDKLDFYEDDIVDSVAPQTTLNFNGPYYNNGSAQWIDTESRVVLTAEDPQPHPVGFDKTYYRYEQVSDWMCLGLVHWEPTSKEDQSWVVYEESFGLPESCHAIEYYSVDYLGNSEDVKVEFVFSDHTKPLAIKEVGEPSSKCGFFDNCEPIWNWYENPGQNIEWEVTVDTPITISCEDPDPHPSGVGDEQYSGIWYRIVWDGKYNDTSANWQFVGTDSLEIKFNKQSEHLLEFYCVDNVEKESETDSELFKVTGESFELIIGDKWDLISVPFNLIGNGDIEDVFDNPEIVEIWSYEGGGWKVYSSTGPSTLDNIVPGRGYWIKTTDSTTVLIGGVLMEPATVPPSIGLDEGWNLIGHYGLSSKLAYCSLFSLVDTQQGFPRWSALWGYDSPSQTFIPLNSFSLTNAGKGYWIEMDVEDSYSPSSVCWGFPQ